MVLYIRYSAPIMTFKKYFPGTSDFIHIIFFTMGLGLFLKPLAKIHNFSPDQSFSQQAPQNPTASHWPIKASYQGFWPAMQAETDLHQYWIWIGTHRNNASLTFPTYKLISKEKTCRKRYWVDPSIKVKG